LLVKTFLTPLQQQQQPFYGPLSGTTRVSQSQKKHSPTHRPDHHPIFISFFHLPSFAQPLPMSLLRESIVCNVYASVGKCTWLLIMVALWNRADHYIILSFVLSSSFFFFSPNLSCRRLDVCHTSTHGVTLVRI